MRTIDGEAAIVTGASSGIGAATAHALGEAGVDLALAARREGRLKSLAETLRSEYGVDATAVPTDVRNSEEVDDLIETTVEKYDSIYALVNNAGLALEGDVETMSDEDYHTVTEVNTNGMFYATRAAIPHLRETGGIVVFMGSIAGRFPRPHNPVYAASKWWTRGFAQSLEGQIGDDGVGVSVINPAEVRTEFGDERGTQSKERFDEDEATSPQAVAEAVRYVLRQDSVDTVNELDIFRRDKLAEF